MKKKLLSILMVTATMLSLVACGEKVNTTDNFKETDHFLTIVNPEAEAMYYTTDGIAMVTIEGYKDAVLEIREDTFLDYVEDLDGSARISLKGYTKEDAERANPATTLESVQQTWGSDEGIIEVYETKDYAIAAFAYENKTQGNPNYRIQCYLKHEDAAQISAAIHIHCNKFDKELLELYLNTIKFSLVEDNNATEIKFAKDMVLEHVNAKEWFKLTDTSLLTEAIATSIRYADIKIISYEDKELSEDWIDIDDTDKFTVFTDSDEFYYYFCRGNKCYFSAYYAGTGSDMPDDTWEYIKEHIFNK